MKNNSILRLLAACLMLTHVFACNPPATESTAKASEVSEKAVIKPDMAKVKAEIQALENAWAVASNAKDVTTISGFYADDAVSMPANKSIIVGKAAIEKDIKADLEKRKADNVVSYETTEVFGTENLVTEFGKTSTKDATGKVTYTGKYMALWEKRNGKWLVIRELYNDDVKEK
jgi:uncharacterized protein (TIGR02246 family)